MRDGEQLLILFMLGLIDISLACIELSVLAGYLGPTGANT